MLARRNRSYDDGWVATTLAVASFGVLVAADQLAAATSVVVAVGAAAGAVLGRWRRARAWAPDAYVASLVALAVVLVVLPDTEGSSLLGAALVPVTVGAIARRTWWRGAGAGAAIVALAVGVVLVSIDGAADRTGALVVTALAAVVCAVLVVVVVRVLVARPPLTSAPGRLSR